MIIITLGGNDEDPRSRPMGGVGAGAGQVTDQGVTSYLVATTPEVLNQLLRENEARGIEFNPALYTPPANALNTAKVDFAPLGHPPPSPYNSRHRSRQISQGSASGSLERSVLGGQGGPRSLPGSAHSTLSRGGSPAGSLEKRGDRHYPGVRRKPSFGASFNSSCQVTASTPFSACCSDASSSFLLFVSRAHFVLLQGFNFMHFSIYLIITFCIVTYYNFNPF